ncbi:MAG: pilus assembly protein [Pirellulaceae bacterium]
MHHIKIQPKNPYRPAAGSVRKGAVAVEFAVTAGIAIMFFFGSFEFCRVSMIRHTADNAVYEGVRAGIIPGATKAEVESATTKILRTLGLTDTTIKVTPETITDDTRELTVEVTIPISKNSFGSSLFFRGKSVKRSLTMTREISS